MRLGSAAFVLVGLVSAALFTPVRAADSPAFEYVRGHATPAAVLSSCLARAKERDAVLVVFDRVTFEPTPRAGDPGRAPGCRDDLAAWYAAVRTACGGSTKRVYVTASTCDRVVEFTAASDAWQAALTAALSSKWWDEKTFRTFEPAHRWIPQLLSQVPGDRRTLVLVTGCVLPEKPAPPPGVTSARAADAEPWRRKLADPGAYWDEEKVAAALLASNTALHVVAPQARFGENRPIDELPPALWASRPVRNSGPRFVALPPEPSPRSASPFPPENDCPSGYGHWPFARAASRSGGAYWFYPAEQARFLDACPRDENLMASLAPPLVSAAEIAQACQADELRAAVLEAHRMVQDATPWTDTRTAEAWRKEGRRLAPVLTAYDRALALLADAKAKLAAGELKSVARRSSADLRITRFWFEMSAFHLEALRLELPVEVSPVEGAPELTATMTPAIRMSDCLDAYDGRASSAPKSSLEVPTDDPGYRAKRDLDAVLFAVDPRLLPRALRMIDAARDVMKHEGRSAWGWSVYYADAVTFRLESAAK